MTDTGKILTVLAAMNQRLAKLTESFEQPFTQQAFAKRVGMHPNTVGKLIRQGKIQTHLRRIPYSELKKFLT